MRTTHWLTLALVTSGLAASCTELKRDLGVADGGIDAGAGLGGHVGTGGTGAGGGSTGAGGTATGAGGAAGSIGTGGRGAGGVTGAGGTGLGVADGGVDAGAGAGGRGAGGMISTGAGGAGVGGASAGTGGRDAGSAPDAADARVDSGAGGGVVLTPARLALTVAPGNATDFGIVTAGTSKTEVFVLTNTGQQASSAITVGLSAVDRFSIPSAISGDCTPGITLAPASFCNVRVSFPAVAGGGAASATLTATATAGGTTTLALSASVHRPATLDIVLAPGSSFSYGFAVIGGPAKVMTYTVRNTGDDDARAIGLSIFSAAGGFTFTNLAGDCMDGVTDLAPGATCPIHVQLLATPPSDSISANLQVLWFVDAFTQRTFSVTLTAQSVFQ